MSHQNPLQTSSGIRPSTHWVEKDLDTLLEDYEQSPHIAEWPFYWRGFGDEEIMEDEENVSQNVMIQKKWALVDISDGLISDKLLFSEQ